LLLSFSPLSVYTISLCCFIQQIFLKYNTLTLGLKCRIHYKIDLIPATPVYPANYSSNLVYEDGNSRVKKSGKWKFMVCAFIFSEPVSHFPPLVLYERCEAAAKCSCTWRKLWGIQPTCGHFPEHTYHWWWSRRLCPRHWKQTVSSPRKSLLRNVVVRSFI